MKTITKFLLIILTAAANVYSQIPEAEQSNDEKQTGSRFPIGFAKSTLIEKIQGYESEQKFSELRKIRRDVLLELPVAKSKLSTLESELNIHQNSLSIIDIDISKLLPPQVLERNLNSAKSRLDKIKINLKNEREKIEKLSDEDKIAFQIKIYDLSEDEAQFANDVDYYTNEIERTKQSRLQLEKDKKKAKNEAQITEDKVNKHRSHVYALQEIQYLVEDAINILLIPTTQKNNFKREIAKVFSYLVGLVIIGFFIVALMDQRVRRSIFSSQSGIQFLTLFSLVIAIILFGITEILEDKELAALLGGISGYILGRVSDSNKEDPTESNPKPPQTDAPALTTSSESRKEEILG